ncbi:FAD/NAD(P)-binding oxidoreductase [Neptuniibacter pectenicola]|uniref:FAD/NAD(P)-binding oxidoreductase n=1 Tax=Neptuniibacter pectenicola TaxID=1806669 RepID=UPI0030EBA921
MSINRRNLLKTGATLGIAGAFGLGAWELNKTNTKAKILITGGGAGGLALSNKLLHYFSGAEITIVDPRGYHWYQPGQTLLLAGAYKSKSKVIEDNATYLDSQVKWVEAGVEAYNPDNNQITTTSGQVLNYDYLIVATGLELRYDMIEGLDTNEIGQGNIASIYLSPEAGIASHQQALTFAQSKGGQALFTRPQGAIKCAGAPMKATNLIEYFVRQAGQRDAFNFEYCTAENQLFSVKAFDQRLQEIWAERQITPNYEHTLTSLDSAAQTAIFTLADNAQRTMDWDFIHIVPPMTTVKSLRESELINETTFKGYLEVDKYTLQHKRYPNVFGIGDTVGTPIGKTAASVKSQLSIVASNLQSLITDQPLTAHWNGYTSCPMILDVGHAMLWEFDYSLEPMTTLPIQVVDPLDKSELAWVMEKSLIRPVYDVMLHGYTPV